MNITKSYRIYTGTRTGHTVLGKMLEMTGRAGRPGEHMNVHDALNLCEKYGVDTYEVLKERIWEAGSMGQEIFSCKMDGYGYYMIGVRDEMMKLRGWEGNNEEEFWADIFPECKNIFLTRRNKVRQAVSWWKAIQDGTWHLPKGSTRTQTKAFYKDKYNFDALTHLLKEAVLKEAAVQEYFSNYGLSAMTVVYEDFIADPKKTIMEILDYLDISTEGLTIGDIPLRKTADAHSEEWVDRFRMDLQEGWDKPAWVI